MHLSLWSAIREYIAAEVELAVCRHEHMRHLRTAGQPSPGNCLEPCEARAWDDHIQRLQEQSTRMETAVREMLDVPSQGAPR
jgi:hypothetical protein